MKWARLQQLVDQYVKRLDAMTPEERRAWERKQRRNWAITGLMLSSDVSLEEAERLADEAEAELDG